MTEMKRLILFLTPDCHKKATPKTLITLGLSLDSWGIVLGLLQIPKSRRQGPYRNGACTVLAPAACTLKLEQHRED